MENGDQILAQRVVMACGVFNTMKLLPESSIPASVRSTFSDIGHSASFFYLFVGMEGDPHELGLRSSNIWHWPHRNFGQMVDEFYADPLNAPIPSLIGFPCSKYSTLTSRFPSKSNVVIMIVQKCEWWNMGG